MSSVEFSVDGRIGRVTLNRPDVLNAINDAMPKDLEAAISAANAHPDVHVIVLSGAGTAFCSGYDLTYYAEGNGSGDVTQEMPWDPMKDYQFMKKNTERFMSVWRSDKPVIAKVHGVAVAGGSDIALCADLVVMAEDAQIGYMPARVWGCPTTAMWVYRLGPERAKRMMFTGDKISGREAAEIGLVLKSVPADDLDRECDALAHRIATVPKNQLMIQKMVINQAIEAMGIENTQMMATLLDGITRHSPEGINFKQRSEAVGWKQAVRERDTGTYDWSTDRPINPEG